MGLIYAYIMHNALLLLGSIIYRSARGTKHFGYHQLEKEAAEPMQRSVTSVHPKRHERRMPGRKVAPVATVNKSEDLLINFDVDCSATPQTTSSAAAGSGSGRPVSQSNADVLSLFDSSVAEKYGHLPPALGEKRHVPYDPFEISEDLKSYASQNATPLHANSATTPSQQYDAASLQHSWSSFDSVSSQDVSEANELASPPPARSQDRPVTDRMFSSATDSRAFAAADAQTGSDTDLFTYANIPLRPRDANEGRQPASNYSNRHSYSYSDCSRPSNRRRRRPEHNDQLASQETVRDLNANSVPARPVSIGDSLDWVSDAVSQISLQCSTDGQSAAATSPALAASTAVWDEKSLTRSMRAAKKKMPPNTGSVFYDDVDDGARTNFSREWKSATGAPPVPPRDFVTDAASSSTQPTDAVYGNIGDRNQSSTSSDVGGVRQLAKVHPFVQASGSDIYQNYSEFSAINAAYSADHSSTYANVQPEQWPTHRSGRSSFSEAVTHGEVGGQARAGDRAGTGAGAGAGNSTIQRVRRLVPAATVDECQTALVVCFGDVDAAARHLKVEQLTRLGIAPRERCRTLLEACSWNLESAGSVLLHQLSTGSAV